MEFEHPDPVPPERSSRKADKDKKKTEKQDKKESRTLKLPLEKDAPKSLGETWRQVFASKKDEEAKKEPTPEAEAKSKDEEPVRPEDEAEQKTDQAETSDATELDVQEEAPGEVVTVELDKIDEVWEIPLHEEPEEVIDLPLEAETKDSATVEHGAERQPEAEKSQEAPEPTEQTEPTQTKTVEQSREYIPPANPILAEMWQSPASKESLVSDGSMNLPPPVWSQQAEMANQLGSVNPNETFLTEQSAAALAESIAARRERARLKRTQKRERRKRRVLERKHAKLKETVHDQEKQFSAVQHEQAQTITSLQQSAEEQGSRLRTVERYRQAAHERLWPETTMPSITASEVVGAGPVQVTEVTRVTEVRSALFPDLPPEAQAIAERLRVPDDHRLEQSSWHTIEVDKKTGRAVETPALTYGEEFKHEQDQEVWQPSKSETTVGGAQAVIDSPIIAGMLPAPQATGSTELAQLQAAAKATSANSTIRDRKQVVSNAGDLGLLFILVIIVVAIIVVASS